MTKLSQISASDAVHVLVYGGPKSGKTELVGRLAEFFDLIWFDLERGVSTLKKLPTDQQEKIDVIDIPDTKTWPIAIETCIKFMKGVKGDICSEHGKYACPQCKVKNLPFTSVDPTNIPSTSVVVFDSLTQLTASGVAQITKNKDDDYKLDYDDWANLGRLSEMFLSHVQQAPFKVVCITHETEVIMEDKSVRVVPTMGTRNFSRNTAKYFDTVAYCAVSNKAHKTYSASTANNKILTGSRAGIELEAIDGANKLANLFGVVTVQKSATATADVKSAKDILASLRK
jgi:hypothetical protein